MNKTTRRRLCVIGCAAALIAAACSSGVAEDSPTTQAPVTTGAAPAPTVRSTPTTTTAPAETETTTAPTTRPVVTEPAKGTERWTALEVDTTRASDGSFEVVVGLAVQRPGERIALMPVSVGVTLFGEWRDCEVDPESWQAEFAPAVHPLMDGRSWDLRLESADVVDDGDGGAAVRVQYAAFGGGATGTLIVTAALVPGCGGEPAQGGARESVTGTSKSQSDAAVSESDEAGAELGDGADEPTGDDEIDPDAVEPDEPQTTEPVSQSVELRRWNHQALIDLPLWSHCPPEVWPDWLTDRLAGFDRTWANWDAETVELGGYHVASGWWTDEQLDRWLPGAGVTAEMAYEHATYHPIMDTVGLWPDTIAPVAHEQGTPRTLTSLRAAMEHRGHNLSSFADMLRATSRGIAGAGAWPDSINVGNLMSSWVRFRYAQPPTTQEPVAWPLASLFQAHDANCVADALMSVCASDETPDQMLAAEHPIGRVLRSLACGQ